MWSYNGHMLKKKLQTYKAVFFDAGDTLITIPAAHEMLQAYLERNSFPTKDAQLEMILSEAITHYYYNKKNYTTEAITPESDRAFWIRIYLFVMERLNAERYWSIEQIQQCCHELYDVFVNPEYYTVFSDVKLALDRLQQMNLRLGLISNFAPTLRDICIKQGIYHYFDPFIVSTEVGLEKPNPEIFTYALHCAGLHASEVLYIGDHETKDIWAPSQIGMDAIRIVRYEGLSGDVDIRSLIELFD